MFSFDEFKSLPPSADVFTCSFICFIGVFLPISLNFETKSCFYLSNVKTDNFDRMPLEKFQNDVSLTKPFHSNKLCLSMSPYEKFHPQNPGHIYYASLFLPNHSSTAWVLHDHDTKKVTGIVRGPRRVLQPGTGPCRASPGISWFRGILALCAVWIMVLSLSHEHCWHRCSCKCDQPATLHAMDLLCKKATKEIKWLIAIYSRNTGSDKWNIGSDHLQFLKAQFILHMRRGVSLTLRSQILTWVIPCIPLKISIRRTVLYLLALTLV